VTFVRSNPGAAWTALAAPLGVRDSHGRQLSDAVPWRLRTPALGLFYGGGGHDKRLVGQVSGLRQTPTELFLTGLLTDPDVMMGVEAGSLFPELDLVADHERRDADVRDGIPAYRIAPVLIGDWENHPEQATTEYAAGYVVAGLTLGTTPAWPQVWIRLDSSPPTRRPTTP
jgi:hypothetical protein